MIWPSQGLCCTGASISRTEASRIQLTFFIKDRVVVMDRARDRGVSLGIREVIEVMVAMEAMDAIVAMGVPLYRLRSSEHRPQIAVIFREVGTKRVLITLGEGDQTTEGEVEEKEEIEGIAGVMVKVGEQNTAKGDLIVEIKMKNLLKGGIIPLRERSKISISIIK